LKTGEYFELDYAIRRNLNPFWRSTYFKLENLKRMGTPYDTIRNNVGDIEAVVVFDVENAEQVEDKLAAAERWESNNGGRRVPS
jgi:hypothetical protein